jgi:hypothetical protein
MKLDLVEIQKLSPRGLWQLAPIRMLIETLRSVIRAGVGGTYSLVYARMLAQQSESLRQKIRENLNMRIKAWVMQCPDRILWVRSVIGEAAIRRWRMNQLADYALSKYFGDWKRKWPHGFKNGGFKNGGFKNGGFKTGTVEHQQKSEEAKLKTISETPTYSNIACPNTACPNTASPYNWQVFALVKIVNVNRFLYGRPASVTEVISTPKRKQLHEKRTNQPIRFTPSELVAEAATCSEETNVQNKAEHLNVENTLLGDQQTLSLHHAPPLKTKPP